MKTSFSRIMASITLILLRGIAPADEPGTRIARDVDRLETRSSSRMRIEMTVYPEGGAEKRVFVIESQERENGDSLASFIEPKSIRGLRILSAGRDSWVYFPSTGRVRKIAGSSRSGSVQGVGGDFSYEDLGAGDWAATYSFDLVSEDAFSWVILGRATAKDATYDAAELTVRKSDGRPTRVRFSSIAEGGFFKILDFLEYKAFGNRTVPATMEMRNMKKESRTVVRVVEAVFDQRLEDRLFDPTRFDK